MKRVFKKLILFILSIFIILNFSCESTSSNLFGGPVGSTPAPSAVKEPAKPVPEVPLAQAPKAETITEPKAEIKPEAAVESIAEAETVLPAQFLSEPPAEENDVFIEELIAEFFDDIAGEPVPEPVLQPPLVTAVVPPPAPAPVQPPPSAPIIQAPTPPPQALPPPTLAQEPEPVLPAQLPEVLPEELTAEEPAERPAPSTPPARSNIPDFPPTRLESLAQMGMTPLDSEIIYSRIVRAAVGQTVEIPFRGNGWVYLGEVASRRGIVYNSRRNESDGQSFIFSLEEAGVYTLKFYRQDFIRDFIINDHVQVIVADAPQTAGAGWLNPPADRGKVIAQPRWPSTLEEAQIRSGARLPSEPTVTAEPTPQSVRSTSRASSQPSTAVTQPPASTAQPSTSAAQPAVTTQPPASTSRQPDTAEIASVSPSSQSQNTQETSSAQTREILAPEILLQKAEELYKGGNIAEAIALLNYFLEDYPSGSDELYWLLGQYYEANSQSRNILLSLDYYKRLINEYPQSSRFNDARRRIAYLERYYINIQ